MVFGPTDLLKYLPGVQAVRAKGAAVAGVLYAGGRPHVGRLARVQLVRPLRAGGAGAERPR
eukprot:2656952-Pyramimonas_sp.AAC.1